MFRVNPSGLPEEPEIPTDLKDLGYFIDPVDNRVKSIEHPTESFTFLASTSERYNTRRKEAVHAQVLAELLSRLESLGIKLFFLPQLTEAKPDNVPNIRILMTPAVDLRQKKRVLVVVNRSNENLGVWAWRKVMGESGIEAGSAVSLAKHLSSSEDAPGLIIVNSGELLYSHRANTTMTTHGWEAQPLPSAVHPPVTIDSIHNKVKGNASIEEHIEFIYKHILDDEKFVAKGAEIYLIGLGDGGDTLVNCLDENWSEITLPIQALALTSPSKLELGEFKNAEFAHFLEVRARAWNLSAHPLGTPLSNSYADCPYPCVSGGEDKDVEGIMPAAYKSILKWFEAVAKGGDRYENDTLVIPEIVKQEAAERARVAKHVSFWDDGDDEEDAADEPSSA